MSMPTPSLKEFMEPVPVCQQTAGMKELLEIFSNRLCDRLVVVDKQQSPLGIVNLPHLVAHLSSKMKENPIDASSSCLERFIEPLATLPADFTPSQFWPYLQAMPIAYRISQHWGLVDSSGKFLGLLDSWLLLKHLTASKDKTTPVSGPNDTWDTCASGATETASEEALLVNALKPLMHLLEQIPLPLKLQTTGGKVLSQNLTWRQQIGEELPEQNKPSGTWKEQFGNLTPSPSPTRQEPQSSRTRGMRYKAAKLATESFALHAGEHRSSGIGESVHLNSLPHPYTESLLHNSQQPLYTPTLLHDSSRLPMAIASSSPSLKPLAASEGARSTDPEAFSSGLGNLKNVQGRIFSLSKIPLINWGWPILDLGLGSDLGGTMLRQDAISPQITGDCFFPQPHVDECVFSNQKLLLVLAQDVTEQQQVAKELVAKNADLIQLNRFKDEFLACISHELKTPLTAILGLSSLLKDQLVGQLNERQAHYARLIHQSGRTLMGVVNDILDLTRIETGCLELTPEPVNIQNVCDRAYLQARQQQSGKKEPTNENESEIPFTLEIEAGLETMVADELRLRQMLVHLLSNALKFTDTSGEIGLKVSRWTGWITFTVWDSGIGIPDEQQHLIFQKFQQLENPLTRQFEGTGLGLVFTQRLARLHGGDVSFISKAGQGSQFTLLLPPNPPQKSVELGVLSSKWQNLTPNSTGKTQHSSSRLVLVVEAAPQYIENLTEHLTSLGYQVVIARSGTEAIEKARRLQPQAVLLNPLLPQLSGWDVLTLLKSDVQTRHIPIVVTTTQAEREVALSNSADGFLSLPVQEEALRQSLTHLTKHFPTICTKLTILCLSPSRSRDQGLGVNKDETDSLLWLHSGLNCRILEADDLEQAELLVRVWHPDVVLLDGDGIDEPLAYLEQLSSSTSLASLPLVTIDRHTTQAANQVAGLSVFPCLAPAGKDKAAALLQVIQVAAGMSYNPSILVVNLATLPDLSAPFVIQPPPSDFDVESVDTGESPSHGKSLIHPSYYPQQEEYREEQKSQNPQMRELASLKALIQYLQKSGLRSLLSRSWAEVCQQLQHQSVDLLLIDLGGVLPNKALLTALTSLANMPVIPPILVLDHRLDGETVCHTTDQEEAKVDLESVLKTVSTPTQILGTASQSMAELLDKINQMLRAG